MRREIEHRQNISFFPSMGTACKIFPFRGTKKNSHVLYFKPTGPPARFFNRPTCVLLLMGFAGRVGVERGAASFLHTPWYEPEEKQKIKPHPLGL